MLQIERLLGNVFEDKRITPTRLDNFAKDFVVRLERMNENGVNTELINNVSPKRETLHAELGEVDQRLAEQKGKTLSVDQVIEKFKSVMREMEGIVAQMLGGYKSTGYHEFYPHGITEYSNATKTEIPTLLNRVNNACLKYRGQLGDTLFVLLQPHEALWNSARAEQEIMKSEVSINRHERSTARVTLERALHVAMHTIAARYPDDVSRSMTYFDFSLLYPVSHAKSNDNESTSGTTLNAATADEVLE